MDMVLEVKFVVMIVVGCLVSVGGLYAMPDETQTDEEAPSSKVLPMPGLFYLERPREPIWIMVNSMDCGAGVDCEFPGTQAIDDINDLKADYVGDDGVVVRWAGTDGRHGSGIDHYDVQVRYDGGEWEEWAVHTTDNSDMFYPQDEGTYDFRSRAVDMAGNTEEYPEEPDATFIVKVYAPGENIDIDIDGPELPVNPHPYYPCPPGTYCANDDNDEDE